MDIIPVCSYEGPRVTVYTNSVGSLKGPDMDLFISRATPLRSGVQGPV